MLRGPIPDTAQAIESAAVREYMDAQKWREVEAQVPQAAQAIESAAAGIKKAAEDFENEMARGR